MVTMRDLKRGWKMESKNRNKRQEVKHEVRGLDHEDREEKTYPKVLLCIY